MVKKKNRRKQRVTSAGQASKNSHGNPKGSIACDEPDETIRLSNEEKGDIIRRISQYHTHLKECSKFLNHLQSLLLDVADDTEEIVCLGLGSLTGGHCTYSSRYQLAFLLLLQTYLGVDSISAYDPAFNECDKEILKYYGITILPSNTEGKHQVKKKTLFFMPRCPFELYNNLLWRNWRNLEQLYIIGNNLTSLPAQYTDTDLCNDLYFIHRSMASISTYSINVEDTPLSSVLNNTVLQFFERSAAFCLSDELLVSLEPMTSQFYK